MATENVQITLKINADGATATLKNFEGKIISSTVPVDKLKEALGGIPVAARKAGASMKVSKKDFDSFAKSVGGFSTATGAASASALELGRVVSDMPYGIRGVANNISQFASMMAMSSRATDVTTGKIVGLSGAIKGLWSALMGPLGILLAIQAVVAGMDYFYGGMKKSTEGVNEFNDSLELLKIKMDLIAEDMPSVVDDIDKMLGILKDDDTKKLDDILFSASLKDNIKILKAEFKDFAKYYDNLKDSQKDDKSFMEGTIRKYQELLRVRKSVSEQEKKILDLTKKERENPKLIIAWDKIRSDYKEALLAKIDLENFFKEKRDKDKDKKDEKISPFKTPKELEIDVANNLSAIQQLQRKTELLNAKTAEEKLEVELKWEKEALHLKEALEKDAAIDKFTKYKRGLDDKLEAYKKSLEDENGVLSEKDKAAIKDAEKRNKDAVLLAEKETDRTIEEITKKYEVLFPFWETLSKARRKALSGKDDSGSEVKKDSTDEYLTKQLKKYAEYAETAKGILSSITSFIDGEFDRELAIEKNKTNAINNELNQRLLNENLSKDERKSIQNQIAKNDELLRQKQEKIEKRRFEMNKAASIAKAVVDTYAAAVGVMKDASGGFFSRLAQAIPTIAFGLAQVATIARQKFVSSAGARTPVRGGGGGSSSGGNDRSFNFNLVGNTQANQIADAIQGRFKQPLKAFVVSRDITTQQELDANIKGSASF